MLEGSQELLVTGSILHIAKITGRNANGTPIIGPTRDVGTIAVLNPTVNVSKVQLFDSRSGVRVQVSERITERTEAYEVTFSNMSLDNLAYTFGADSVDAYTQPGTAQTGVNHLVFPDSKLHLHDSSGNYLYDIASVASIGSLVAGTDYTTDATGLRMGYVNILPDADVDPAGETLAVTFTPHAITGDRTFNPLTAGTAKVVVWIYWPGDDDDSMVLRDHVEADLSPASPEMKDTDYSNGKFSLTITADPSNATRPAGRFLKPRGTLPPRTL